MSENLKDILSSLNPDIDQQTLLLYLQGKLPAEEQHEVEKKMLHDDFETDALEGLESFDDKKKLTELVHQLNTGLQKKIEKKKRRTALKIDFSTIITVIIILLLIILSYTVIHRLIGK